jgi:hypothetical protein
MDERQDMCAALIEPLSPQLPVVEAAFTLPPLAKISLLQYKVPYVVILPALPPFVLYPAPPLAFIELE